MTIRYVNASTGQIVESDEPQPVFDRSAKWAREEVDEKPADKRKPAKAAAQEQASA